MCGAGTRRLCVRASPWRRRCLCRVPDGAGAAGRLVEEAERPSPACWMEEEAEAERPGMEEEAAERPGMEEEAERPGMEEQAGRPSPPGRMEEDAAERTSPPGRMEEDAAERTSPPGRMEEERASPAGRMEEEEEEEERRASPAGGEGDGAPALTPIPPCEMVDLGGRGLESLPEHILHMPALQNLYLEGNAISGLSEDFFHQLPNLLWLDLRNNKLTMLPLSIGDHRCLKTLLLEGNPIRKLPVELGNLTSLKALNLRKCPIVFPPEAVMHQGLIAILAFLRMPIVKAGHDTGFATTLQQEAQLIFDEYRRKVDRGNLPKKTVSEVWKKMNVSKSSLSFSDEKERQRFKTLKQKLMQEEKRKNLPNLRKSGVQDSCRLYLAFLGTHFKEDGVETELVACENKYELGAGRGVTHIAVVVESLIGQTGEKTPNLNALFPELTAYDMTIQTKRKHELRLAAMKEHKEKQAFIEQRMKDQKALRIWRDQAKLMQEKKETEIKQWSVKERNKELLVKSAPYATDPNYYHIVKNVDLKGPPICESRRSMYSGKEIEEKRAAKDKELQEQIQKHIKLMRERRKRQKGNPQEELEAAKRDLEIAANLKSSLARRKVIDGLL
ncbi:leucine-rich repeat-containing protein 27-like [Scyliorhinus canicula]|uniref:leucine-rich repeat-containing protein 27-like n=1 Tax=Scyliorhinus canicula TaxID=7830 RepID=UPI0018F3CC36|nr:leucine-rich repeat-containing protein 27-like [Scyliorhinus canicula]